MNQESKNTIKELVKFDAEPAFSVDSDFSKLTTCQEAEEILVDSLAIYFSTLSRRVLQSK